MKKTTLMAAMAAVTISAVTASVAHAQSKPLEVWQPPQQGELDPAKRVPQAPQPATNRDEAPQSAASPQPAMRPQAYASAAPAAASYEEDRGGFFLGVQAGKGWVYEDVDQSGRLVNAGYRWQAGAVTLVGVELAHGRLDETRYRSVPVSEIDYTSIGANARFNFGRTSPLYGLVRTGYWRADDNDLGGSIDGAYVGVGIGVDFNRQFNMSLTYTNHVYFEDYYWGSDYEINSAETLMLGAEVRF